MENTTAKGSQYVYSVPVGPVKEGETRAHRHPDSEKSLLVAPAHIKNLADFWDEIVSRHKSNLAVQDKTFGQVNDLSKAVGSWLVENKHEKIYLYAKNSPEWTITDVACWNYGVTNIPLYDTLGKEALGHILNLTKGTAIFMTNSMTEHFINKISENLVNIGTVVYLDNAEQSNLQKLQKLNLKVHIFKDLYDQQVANRPEKMTLDSHLTYTFTSGTTGLPKGVVGTHHAVIAQCMAMKDHYEYLPTDVHLSFLPIAHTFERFVCWMLLYFGGNIRYSQFPITELVKDFARTQPTTVPMVPRLLNRFYPVCKGIYEKTNSKEKIKGLFGGKVRIVVTGSAPISPEILSFFREMLECDIREGYGQTETTAASFVTYENDTNYGHVGGPNRSIEFKLVSVPEMEYLVTDSPPRGQVCERGASIFNEYFLDEKNTKETVDADGWNHSGDIGVVLPNGALKIIDRKKNIFKLSQGEYIAPEKIENIYVRCPYVAECFLYGDSLKDYNVSVIHPNLEVLSALAKNLSIEETDPKALCVNAQINEYILKEMTEHAKKEGLLGFEIAKKVTLWPVSFMTLGIFTSSLKLQRHIAKQAFEEQIKQMYGI